MLLPVENLRGEVVLGIGTMNSGKSEDLGETYEKLKHSGYRNSYVIFSNSRNTRDRKGKIVSGSGKVIDNVLEADADHIEEVLQIIASREVGRQRIDVVIFDEFNLHGSKFVSVVKALRNRGAVVVCYGLNLDFRGEDFPVAKRLQEIARARETITGKRLVHTFESYCCVTEDGKQCGSPAGYTLRVVKTRDRQSEIRFIDDRGNIISGFSRAPYFGPTILVEGSSKDVLYTTACERHFGEVPGKRLTESVLLHVQKGSDEDRTYGALARKFGDRELPEVIAFALEERRLDINRGQYKAKSNGDHPTWDETESLMELSKTLDSSGRNSTLDVYRMIKSRPLIDRAELTARFRDVRSLERILSGLMINNFVVLEGASFIPTPYVMDIASGMYVPLDSANQ